MPRRCWAENAMPQWNCGASRHLWIDFVITTALTSMENRLTPGPERGQHQTARTLIKLKKKTSTVERGGGFDVILSDHHTGPVSYQAEDLSSPLNFTGLMKRPDTGWIKKKRRNERKNYGNTKWGEMRLWSAAFWYLVESLCNNLLVVQYSKCFEFECRLAKKWT